MMLFFVKHGSWLDMAEIELNVMTRQCLSRRISTLDKLKCELSAWEMERNRDTAKIQWHFQTGDAREKLISLYPTLSSVTFLIKVADILNFNDTVH